MSGRWPTWAISWAFWCSACSLVGSGSSGELLGAYLALVVPGKLSAPWYLLLLRGVLCNFLVCIGVFVSFRLQSETAKALVIALAITTFVLTGLEHSIANMAYFALHALLNGGADWAAMGWNLLWVTLGNLLGGAVLLGLPFGTPQSRKRRNLSLDNPANL
ncbi:MAG: formate/nitrite transporter family protein [Flavonifractor plautii]